MQILKNFLFVITGLLMTIGLFNCNLQAQEIENVDIHIYGASSSGKKVKILSPVSTQEENLVVAIQKSLIEHIEYPELALRNGIEESCQFRIELNAKNELKSINIVKGNGKVFEKAVKQAISLIDFKNIVPQNYSGRKIFFMPILFEFK